MSNRVKTGDLAIVVNSYNAYNDGKLVTVIRKLTNQELERDYRRETSGPAWLIESLGGSLISVIVNARTGEYVRNDLVSRRGIAEFCLKPIRDPGEDATDEMVLLKPLPQKGSV